MRYKGQDIYKFVTLPGRYYVLTQYCLLIVAKASGTVLRTLPFLLPKVLRFPNGVHILDLTFSSQ